MVRAHLVAGACALALAACDDDSLGPPPGDDGSNTRGAPTSGGPADPSAGCSSAVAPKGFVANQSLTVAGARRSYQLFAPEGYEGRTPLRLVFVFHGDGGTGSGIRSTFKQLEAETAGGAVLVYPDGENKTWRIDEAKGLANDVGFVEALSAEVLRTYCVDQKRIFAVGFSKGAYFTNMLGCLSKTGFRAVVGHGGGGPFGVEGSGTKFNDQGELMCPQPPVAAMQVIGESDGLLREAKKSREHWQRVNACEPTTTPHAPSPCVEHVGCATGRPEVYCQIPKLGHQVWSEGSKATWAFLERL